MDVLLKSALEQPVEKSHEHFLAETLKLAYTFMSFSVCKNNQRSVSVSFGELDLELEKRDRAGWRERESRCGACQEGRAETAWGGKQLPGSFSEGWSGESPKDWDSVCGGRSASF